MNEPATAAERRDWLQGYEFALRNLSDEAVQADLARVRAESDTHGSDGQSGQPRTVRESGATTTAAGLSVDELIARNHATGDYRRCPGNSRHWFAYRGWVGSSSPTCIRCEAPNPAYRPEDDPFPEAKS